MMKKMIGIVTVIALLLSTNIIFVQATGETGRSAVIFSTIENKAEKAEFCAIPKKANMELADGYQDCRLRDGRYISDYEAKVLYFVNKYRTSEGLEPLSMTIDLQKATEIRAKEIIQKFDHNRPNGSSFSTVLEEYNIPYSGCGENIAAGQFSPEMVMSSWIMSEGHRNNIMGSHYTRIGVGHYFDQNSELGNYWVQIFTGGDIPKTIQMDFDTSSILVIPKIDSIDMLGLGIEVVGENEVSYMPLIEEMCSPIDVSSKEIQDVTVTYRGLTTTFQVIVMPFDDVSVDAWYCPYVAEANYMGLMTGLDEHRFGPEETLARAQFAMILYRMVNSPEVEFSEVFSDVPSGQWFTDAVLWANKNKIVTGYSHNHNFGPADKITREQMAVMMYRFANSLELNTTSREDFSSFKDAENVSDFAKEAMSWAIANNIIQGKNNGTLIDPQGYALRAECATIISRFMKADI